MSELLEILGILAIGTGVLLWGGYLHRGNNLPLEYGPPKPVNCGKLNHDEDRIDGWETDKAVIIVLWCKKCGQIRQLVSSPYLLYPQSKIIESWPERHNANA